MRRDHERYIGSVLSAVNAPRVFDLDENDCTDVNEPNTATVTDVIACEAARDCPTEAIVPEDDFGNQHHR